MSDSHVIDRSCRQMKTLNYLTSYSCKELMEHKQRKPDINSTAFLFMYFNIYQVTKQILLQCKKLYSDNGRSIKQRNKTARLKRPTKAILAKKLTLKLKRLSITNKRSNFHPQLRCLDYGLHSLQEIN